MQFEPSNRVQYFSGQWCEDGAEREGVRRALRAVWGAVLACPSRDVRQSADLADALAYLTTKMSRPVGMAALRRALDLPDPALRFQAARAAYEQMARRLGLLAT